MSASYEKTQALLAAAQKAAEPAPDDFARIRSAVAHSVAGGVVAGGAAATAVSALTGNAAASSGVLSGSVAGGGVASGTVSGVRGAQAAGQVGSATAGAGATTVVGHIALVKLAGVAVIVGVPAFMGGLLVGKQQSVEPQPPAPVLAAPSEARTAQPEASESNHEDPGKLETPDAPTAEPKARLQQGSNSPSAARVAPEPASESEPPITPDSLGAELALLSRAQRAQRLGNSALALGILHDLQERHPEGALSEEAEVLAISALCAAERFDEANARSARFVQAHPGSVHIARIRAGCAPSEEEAHEGEAGTEE